MVTWINYLQGVEAGVLVFVSTHSDSFPSTISGHMGRQFQQLAGEAVVKALTA